MAAIHIVTDSGARFSNTRLTQQYPMTVLPYKLAIGGKLYREGIDLSDEDAMRLIQSQSKPPHLVAPSVEEYAATYTALSRIYDGVVSLHTSRELNDSWHNAQRAAQQVSDFCEVAVIDSRSICGGQGMLVRRAVDRLYAVFYVDSLDYLHYNRIMTHSRSILGTMLKIKAFISLEEGEAVVTEKVRTRSQAIDRLVEFLVEFEELDDAMIVQNREQITEQARQLQDRLSAEFPGRHFSYGMYGLALGSILGGDVTGVVVLESEIEGFYDD